MFAENSRSRNHKRYFIINADDFGLSTKVNQGILAAHQKGFLTSTSLMANGPMFQQAVEMSSSAPRLGVGVHINLMRGKPLSKLEHVRHLIDERGVFPGLAAAVIFKLLRQPDALNQAERECTMQVQRVLAAGITPTHIDSEKHLHMFPPLFLRVARVAVSNGIRWIRVAGETRITWRRRPGKKQVGKAFLLRFFALRCRRIARRAGLRSADSFNGVVHAGRMLKDVYEDIINQSRAGVTEVISHPGFKDENPQDGDMGPYFISDTRQNELEALLDAGVRQKMQHKQIEIVCFGDLK